jgi:hypothetical protein
MVTLRSTFEELFGHNSTEKTEEERKANWAEWKRIAIAHGDKDQVDGWSDISGCYHDDRKCIHLSHDGWCDLAGLPCTVNPYLSFNYGMVGMACIGCGFDDGINQQELNFEEVELPF